jgi:beta-lactamase class A/beta-lactamase class A CARB-5
MKEGVPVLTRPSIHGFPWATALALLTPGDPRDTTTPRAMMQTLYVLTLGTALNGSAREQLTRCLRNNQVGGPLLRAGLPQDWRIADRTGAGGFVTRGVIAVLWPPRRAPIVAAIYVTDTTATMDRRNAAIAAIGRAIADAVAHDPAH